MFPDDVKIISAFFLLWWRRILITGVRLQEAADVDNVWRTCCPNKWLELWGQRASHKALVFYDCLCLYFTRGNMSDDDVTKQVLKLSDCTMYTGRLCTKTSLN